MCLSCPNCPSPTTQSHTQHTLIETTDSKLLGTSFSLVTQVHLEFGIFDVTQVHLEFGILNENC
jgi:hypothetical protein